MGFARMLSLALALAAPAAAQDFGALARLLPEGSRVADEAGGVAVTLRLSQPVPWRLWTLDAPPRLVIDLREVAWGEGALLDPGGATALALGRSASGWSRAVVELEGPMAVGEAGMAVDEGTGEARLRVLLQPTDAAAFAAAAGPPADEAPAGAGAVDESAERGPLVVAIDPGHGGIDPGAEREGLREAHLMLALGLELAEAVAREGMVPVLTRRDDGFVALGERMTAARAAGADVLLSLHADALEGDAARGASVYTLSAEALDGASERMVERHGAGDLLGGLDLTGQDDTVATALMDLARLDTGPRADRLAGAIVEGLEAAGAAVNSRPRREAPLAVLNAADFPSALVEVGFLSDEGDRARLATPEGRAPIVRGIVGALLAWEAEEAALAGLLRR